MKVRLTFDISDTDRDAISRYVANITRKRTPKLATREMLIDHIRKAVRNRNIACGDFDLGLIPPSAVEMPQEYAPPRKTSNR